MTSRFPHLKRAALIWIPILLIAGLILATVLEQRRTLLTSSLVRAVNSHESAQVEMLLSKGADPNVRDWKTYYPGSGVPFRPPWYEKYLARLMHRSPRPADPYIGPTVLMIAAHNGDTKIVESLLDHGADPSKLGTGFQTYHSSGSNLTSPLWEAIENQYNGVPSALILIRRGAPVNARYIFGITPLLETFQPQVFVALVNKGANVNACTDSSSPLMYAVQFHDLSIIRLLVDKGANIEGSSAVGRITPLMAACSIRSRPKDGASIVTYLLMQGAKINARDGEGKSALIDAAIDKNIPIMKLLLEYGADGNTQDKSGETALMLVSYHGFEICLPRRSPWRQDRKTMQALLLHYGANPHLKDKQGKTFTNYETVDDPGEVCGP